MMRIINSGQTIIRLIPIFLVLFSISCSNPQNNKTGKKSGEVAAALSVEPFRLDSLKGWGYEIVTNNKVFIHQKYIPALEGNRIFTSREDALKVGNMVRDKLLKKQSPALTKQEIYDLLDIRE
jgi:hypothetical protein